MQNSSLWGLDIDKDFENSILTSLTPVIENELTKNVIESSVLTEIGSATNSANISEPDLFNFLKKYDIEDVYTFLEGKHLTLESLRYLNDFDLKELIPLSHLGLRIKLRRQLTHWKLTEFGEGNLTNTTLTASSKVQEWINTVEVNEPEGHNKENLNNISVQEILNADSHGKHVLKTRRLNPDSRLKISRIIVDYFILENIILRKSDFQRLAIDICSCFPEETQDYYYTPGGVKKRQGGALYFRYINSRHKLKLKSPEPQSGASETQSSTSVQEIDETIGENIKKWLQFNLDEYQEILEKWEASFEYRRREIIKYSSNAEYFQQWPVLKSINGSKLLLIDFNLLYPDHENCLFNKWDLFKKKIIPYLQENLKDKQNLKLFVESKSQTENTQNYMLCNLLNAVLGRSELRPVDLF